MLIFGLGNPGEEYLNTRHNVGFMAIDKIAERFHQKTDKSKYSSIFGEFNFKGKRHYLIKPTTYMNLSGKSVKKWINEKKVVPEDILVIYDDIDLPLGTIRLRKEGGAGTHKGMLSIVEEIRTEKFPRLRIGINNGEKIYDLASFVLSEFTEDELQIIKNTMDSIPEIIVSLLSIGIERTMTKFNRKNLAPSEQKGAAKNHKED